MSQFLSTKLGRKSAALAAMSVVIALAGTTYAVASTSAPTATTAYTDVHLSASMNLSRTGGVMTTLLTVTLPENASRTRSYVLSAYGDLVNFGPSDYTRCHIEVNGAEVRAVSTIVGAPTGPGSNGPAAYLSTFALAGGVRLPAGNTDATAELQCWHDQTNGSTPYVDGGVTMLVHPVPSLRVIAE
jgi:hypothetical protein